MKILHISPEATLDNEILGGRGIWLKKILPLQAKNHEVKLLSMLDDINCKSFDKEGYEIIQANKHYLPPHPEGNIGGMKQMNMHLMVSLVKLLKVWQPDIIHVHESDFAEGFINVREMFNLKTKIIYTIHLSQLEVFFSGLCRTGLQHYLANQEIRMVTEIADRIHVCSQAYKNMFWTLPTLPLPLPHIRYWTQKPVEVIYNGVAEEDFGEKGDTFDNGYKNIFFAGRFARGKGIETICEAISDMPDCRFIFAGQFNGLPEEAKEYPTTKALNEINDKFQDRVVFLGQLRPHSVIGKMAKQCDAWVAPSWHCPFELVGLEAMACGVPLVCTDTGAFSEYGLDGYNCIMCEPQNHESLKKAIYKAIEQKDTLIKGGYETIKKYTWEKTNSEMEKLYAS